MGWEVKECVIVRKSKSFEIGGRIINFLKAIIVPFALYLAIKSILRGLSWDDITSSLLSYQLIVPHSWFILTLIKLYLMFWLACRLSEKYFLLVITTIVGLYTAIVFLFHVESSYYSPVPGFIAGILFYHLLPFFEKYHHKAISMSFVVLIIALAIYELIPPLEMFYNLWLFIYPSAILLSAVITKNKVVEFFSNISYEIYLSQGAAFIIAYTVCDNPWMVFLVTSVLSVLLAWLSKRLTQVFFNCQSNKYIEIFT